MTTWFISGALGFVSGAAVIWFFREKIEGLVIDANKLSAKLHAKADEIAARARKS